MGEKFYPDRFLKQVMPKSFYTQGLVSKNFTLQKGAISAINRARLATGRPIDKTVYDVLLQYKAKYKDLIAAEDFGKTQAFEAALNGENLLRQRIEQAVIFDKIQDLKVQHKGEFYRWMPSSAENPDPQHGLLYGKIFRVGEGDKEGNMPGERYGCQCGIEWLGEEEAFKEFAGPKITGNYKGQRAVRKLVKEQKGYIPNAFRRTDLGGISLVWGDKDKGLKHIIHRRTSQKIDVQDFLKDLTTVVQDGKVYPNITFPKERLNVWHRKKQKLVVISKYYGNIKKPWVLTAFKQKKAPKR